MRVITILKERQDELGGNFKTPYPVEEVLLKEWYFFVGGCGTSVTVVFVLVLMTA